MSSPADIIIFGIASSGSVEQWDRHATPTGILLRWFLNPALNYPDLGFDIYRAIVPDVPPLPFNDLNVPAIQGKPSWTYANVATLATTASTGLRFAQSGPGWWRLLVTGAAPVTVKFTSPAWFVTVRADAGTTALQVVGKSAGVTVKHGALDLSGTALAWRTRGIEELELSGMGSVSFIGYHLLGDTGSWAHVAHRCLPVLDPAYRCAPPLTGTEAAEARSRLPAAVAAEWNTRFDASFTNLLPALHRWATGAAAAPIPAASGNPDVHIDADERVAIELSMLDPHGARILGLAYDDPLGGSLDGREYVYKVVGRWLANPVVLNFSSTRPINPPTLQRLYGLTLDIAPSHVVPTIVMTFAQAVTDFSIALTLAANANWIAIDAAGHSSSGTVTPHAPQLSRPSLKELRVTWAGSTPPAVTRITFTPIVEKIGLLPGIVAVEPGPAPGPGSLAVSVSKADSSSALAVANLDWSVIVAADGSIPEGQPISYQVGHRRLNTDPTTAQPTPKPPADADLMFDRAPVFLAAAQLQLPLGQRVLVSDRGLASGWWGWWIRGVDLFGRVSKPSAWALAAVADVAPPPAPILVHAEWVQRNLPASTVAALGRSVEARRWLTASTADDGLIACWAYGPDQASVGGDVDGFRLLVRTPAAPSGAPAGAALQYSDPWPSPIANYGPMAISASGLVTAALSVDPILDVNISAIQVQPRGAAVGVPQPSDPVRSVCQTDLELDGASGVFVGGSLKIGTDTFPIVANGDGSNLAIVVEHTAGAGPKIAIAQLVAPVGQLTIVPTDAAAITPPAGLRARSGVLVVGTPANARRMQVLGTHNGAYLVRPGGASANVGEPAVWYPAWCAALDANGFGPVTSDTVPIAHAQVAVEAVRSINGLGVTSTPSVPITITAVDVTTPATPDLHAITFDPGEACAVLASRADWYGKSRFTVSWTAESNRQFIVYRALGDEINRLDRLAHDTDAGIVPHDFSDPSVWPAGVYADATRKARVDTELSAIDQAYAVTDDDAREAAIDAAYQALTIDTQVLLAQQDYAWPAYVALFGKPIDATSYEDTFEGRSGGHWFYRVTARTLAGIEGAPSAPTPPICCPDVVPPAAPMAHMALAGAGQVTLRWLASPEADWNHYEIFASTSASAGSELESLTPLMSYAPTSHQGGVVIALTISRPVGDWCFWIVSVDASGNRSRASAMLRGKSLRTPPVAPVWQTPVRTANAIFLSWTHPIDPRLACLVERRPRGGGFWTSVSGWLPRAVYAFDDVPPILEAGWDYRLRVRDQLGQVASDLPIISIQAV
jgi:hypothetical protein